MSFRKAFFKNILVVGGYNYATQLVAFLSTLITSRLINPESYGLVGLITVFSGFISMFTDSGLSMAVIRSNYTSSYYRGLNSLALIIGLLLCLVTIILIYPIAVFYENKSLVLPGIAIAFLFICRSLTIVPTAILQKRLEFSYVGKITFIGTFLSIISTIVLASSGFEYWSLIWPQFVNVLFVTLILSKKVNLSYSFARVAVIKKSYQLTRTLIGSLLGFNVVNYWSRNLDNLLIGKMYGPGDLGIYSRAYSMLAISLSLISGIFPAVLYPSLARLKKEGGNTQSEFYLVLKVISLLNIPVAFILLLYPEQFVNIMWGPNWLKVAQLLPYFGLLIMIQSLLTTVGSLLILEGEEKTLMISGWVSAVFIISAIVIGAFISLEATAAFYCLFYILFVVSFNVYYLYYYTLKHSLWLVIEFWLPKIILSLSIWIAIYWKIGDLLFLSFGLWLLMILLEIRKEIKEIISTIIFELGKFVK